MRPAPALALLLAICLALLPGCGERDTKPGVKKDKLFRGMKRPTDRFNTDRSPKK
jgi:hypothetical protein